MFLLDVFLLPMPSSALVFLCVGTYFLGANLLLNKVCNSIIHKPYSPKGASFLDRVLVQGK